MAESAWASVENKNQKCLIIVAAALIFISLIISFICAIACLASTGQQANKSIVAIPFEDAHRGRGRVVDGKTAPLKKSFSIKRQ